MSDAAAPATEEAHHAPVHSGAGRTESIRIRVTPQEHIALKTSAHRAGLSTSAYMRSRSLKGLDQDGQQR